MHVAHTIDAAEIVVPMLNLATGLGFAGLDSPAALQKADAAGGADFSARTYVGVWSMELTVQQGRLVWIVQDGAPLITQAQRLTVTIDATTGEPIA